MNIFIISDLEGIPGVTSIDQMDVTTEGYQKAKEALTECINKTAEYCFEEGVEKVYYVDGHGGINRDNIIHEKIKPELISYNNLNWTDLIENKMVDAVIELGSHARAGTLNGFLDHTANSRTVFMHKLNGREFGELALHAAFCGEYDIPVIACIGDETACDQAIEYIPQIHNAAVKHAIGRNKAIEVEAPYEIIKKTVKEAIKNWKNIKPFRVEGPITVEITYYRTDMCEEELARCSRECTRKDARTLTRVIDNAADYWDLYFY